MENEHEPEEEAVQVDPDDVEEVLDQGSDEAMSDSDNDEKEDYVDESIQGFFEHKDSIYCIALSPANSNLCATGGGDDLGYLWDISNGTKLATLTGHTDSITSVAFSFDGAYLASSGMDGLVRVWRVHETRLEFITVLEAGSEVLWLRFHPKGAIILAGTTDGTVWMWNLPKGDVMGVFASHTAPVNDGCWAADGKSFSSVSEDGTIIQWDPRSAGARYRWETSQDERMSGGEGGWNVIALDSTGDICTVGSAEGKAKVINLTTGALLSSLDTQSDSIESIVYATSLPLMALASIDGSIAVYEVPSMKLRTTLQHDDAVVALRFEAGTPFLFSASTDRTVRKWDVRTSAEIARWRGHQDAILCMVVQKGGRKVITAGDDKVALVFGEV